MVEKRKSVGHGIVLNKLRFLIAIFVIFLLSSPVIALSENNGFNLENGQRSARLVNTDNDPVNDNFNGAEPIQYHSSGTTHIFMASVGGSSDPRDFWRLDADIGSYWY
jgi:hypothetical protein